MSGLILTELIEN